MKKIIKKCKNNVLGLTSLATVTAIGTRTYSHTNWSGIPESFATVTSYIPIAVTVYSAKQLHYAIKKIKGDTNV